MSFSLVAGALCHVYFSNKVTGIDTTSVTLNINSTGAKTLNTPHSESRSDSKEYTDWRGFESGTSYNYHPAAAKYIIAVYNGSSYSCSPGYEHYDDYKD